MKRRKFIQTTAFTAAAFGTAPLHALAAAKKKPNVIVLFTDDQGYGDFSCHGNPVLKTPHMDTIAKEGVDFTDFHCTPVCTPSRGQLMTGMDALHNLACCVTSGRTLLRRDIPTMAEFFRKGGYATGLFGKWHLGHAYPDRPMDKGFDKCVWFKGWGLQSEIEFDNDYINTRYYDGTQQTQASGYCTDLWFNEAINWMEKQKEKPFFVYLPTNVPHMPLWPPEKYADLYKGKVGPAVADFFAMIANLDDNVGRLDEWLKKNGLFENTIVVLLTDNGGTAGRPLYNAGLRESKASNYEGGHRCACFLRWPNGGFDAGLSISTPTQVQDLLPSLIELCDLPAGKAKFDGVSLLPLLKKGRIKERMFVVQYGQRQRPVQYDAAVIWKQWRLQNGKELYDIEKDRQQATDVAAQFPDVAARMKVFYEAWWGNLAPALNSPVPMLIGTDVENPVLLTSIDWWEVDADNINFVSQAVGGPRGGAWNVQVEKEGSYRIELRRWPFHTNMPIGSAGPRKTITGRPLDHKYRLIPAQEAVFSANGVEQRVSLTQESVGASFEVQLSRGKSRLQGWFRDANGMDLCGAFYARITRL